MYNPFFSQYTDKINNEALFPRFGLVMRMYLLISKKILELLRKIYHKTRMIRTRPTPVLRKIHKMGAPLFCF